MKTYEYIVMIICDILKVGNPTPLTPQTFKGFIIYSELLREILF